MAYVLKNSDGNITAASAEAMDGWDYIDETNEKYAVFLEAELTKQNPFRESDIQLARVLEDLIEILISRNLMSFTDFPSAAQKRLNERQAMRHGNGLSILDDNDETI